MARSKIEILKSKQEYLMNQAKKHEAKPKEINNEQRNLLFAHQARIGKKLETAYGDTIPDDVLNKLVDFVKACAPEQN